MLAERFETTVISLMTEDEARQAVVQINHHMNSARAILLDLYERRGWAALGYASWRECVVAEFDASKTHLYRELEAAHIEQRISPMGEIGTIPERQLRPLAALTPMEQPIAWDEANARTEGRPTARVVEDVVREMRGDPVNDELDPPMELEQTADQFLDAMTPTDKRLSRMNAGLYSSETPEWYTPAHIVDRVLDLFETIDLDPCSNSADWREANVPAEHYYTKDDNGLAQPWHGKVYMNPPYGDEVGAWVEYLCAAYAAKQVEAAVALLPARTETDWFAPLLEHPICFVHGRLKFLGGKSSAPFPSVVVYLGNDLEAFHSCFHTVGPILVPYSPA